MIRFIGLDVHKRVVEAAIISEKGQVIHRSRFPCVRESLVKFCESSVRPGDRVALEATTNTWGVLDILRPLVSEVVVSNPLRTKAIAQAKIKTDKVDAQVLAQLLRAEYLPTVWQPDDRTRQIRTITSRRSSLVSDRTRLKNRVHSVLHQRLVHCPFPDLFSKRAQAWLETVELDDIGRRDINSELALLKAVEQEIAALDQDLAKRAYDDSRAKLLMTLPGVDYPIAQTLLGALGDIKRFNDADHAASYLGLVPSTKQSAEQCYHGRITKQGNGHARWMLVQAAQRYSSHPGPLGVFFRRLAKKKNRNVAVVATARKLVVIAWHMLTKNEPYRYALPMATSAKLSRLRVKATGKRRRGGTRKGEARPANYGTGNSTRAIPSLSEALTNESIPCPEPLRPGEQRMLKEQKLLGFLRRINTPHRELRRMAEPGEWTECGERKEE